MDRLQRILCCSIWKKKQWSLHIYEGFVLPISEMTEQGREEERREIATHIPDMTAVFYDRWGEQNGVEVEIRKKEKETA